jgi:hypothetical protein
MVLGGRANILSQLPEETRSLNAWDAYFEHYREKAPSVYYLRYIRAIERHDHQHAKDRVEALFQQAQEIWPVELLTSKRAISRW